MCSPPFFLFLCMARSTELELGAVVRFRSLHSIKRGSTRSTRPLFHRYSLGLYLQTLVNNDQGQYLSNLIYFKTVSVHRVVLPVLSLTLWFHPILDCKHHLLMKFFLLAFLFPEIKWQNKFSNTHQSPDVFFKETTFFPPIFVKLRTEL